MEKTNVKYKVDMGKVARYDNCRPYLRLVQQEIRNGEGFVEVLEIKDGLAQIYAHETFSYLFGCVTVPLASLTKI
jgi:hypothetical protein